MENLFQADFPKDRLEQRVVSHGYHPVSDGLDFELVFRSLGEYHLFEVFGHFQHFEKPGTPFVPFAAAVFASRRIGAVEREIFLVGNVAADALHHVVPDGLFRLVRDLAVRAELACQALRDDEFERRYDEKRVDAQVRETLEGVYGRVRVDGGKHQMAGDGSFHGQMRGLGVADFSDHHDVRILSEQRAEAVGERKPDLRVDLRVVDSRDAVFDRVFQRRDVAVFGIEARKHRVERGGLSRAGRTDDEDEPVARPQVLFHLHHVHRKHADGPEIEALGLFLQNADDDLFAVDGGDDAHAQVDFLAGFPVFERGLPVLGEAGFVDLESGEDLDSRDDGGLLRFVGARVFDEVSVDAEPDPHSEFRRFEMDVGRALPDGGRKSVFDEPDSRKNPRFRVSRGGVLGRSHQGIGIGILFRAFECVGETHFLRWFGYPSILRHLLPQGKDFDLLFAHGLL